MFDIDKRLGIQIKTISRLDIRNDRNSNFERYKNAITKGISKIKYNLKIYDKVLIYKEPMKNKFIQKWWDGYKITQVIEPSEYVVSNGESK